ncbi:hypothetical protein D3C80_976360 [compost metagenome]
MHQRSVLADIAEVAFLSFKKGQCRRGAILQKVQTSTAEGGAQHGIGHGPLQQAAAIGEDFPRFVGSVQLAIHLSQGGRAQVGTGGTMTVNRHGARQLCRANALGLKDAPFLQVTQGPRALGDQGHFRILLGFRNRVVIQAAHRLLHPSRRQVGNGQQRWRTVAGHRVVIGQGLEVIQQINDRFGAITL